MTAYELTGRIARSDLGTLEARLALAGFDSWWVDQPIEHPAGYDDWDHPVNLATHATIHIQLADPDQAGALQALVADLLEAASTQAIESEDWLRTWRDGREVVLLDDGWSIAPPWLAASVPDPDRCVLIDPGLAFGAGDHPSTRESARHLLHTLQPGDQVLDLGAGSGVLSLLAQKAGAGRVLAIELDPQAATEIPRNEQLNGLSGTEVLVADAAQLNGLGPFDVLTVNIGARAAHRFCELCDQWAAPSARIILAGLTTASETAVITAYNRLGWDLAERSESPDQWVCLTLQRSPETPC